MQLLKIDAVSNKPEKPAPDAPAPSSASVQSTPSSKSPSLPPSAAQPPQAPPAELGQDFKDQGLPVVEGTGAKEEYGYIVTNRRSAQFFYKHI